MTAADQLKRDADDVRVYSSDSPNLKILPNLVEAYRSAYGGDWGHGFQLLSAGKDMWKYKTSHLIKYGGEGLTVVEQHFGVSLPSSAHAFYVEIAECVLSLRRVIVVMAPEDIIAYEEDIRDVCDDKSLITPIRVIRFAHLPNEPLSFAFRQSCADGKWRIMLVSSVDDSLDYYHSKVADDYVDDEDIDAWMERLLRTDGFPLIPGREQYEHYGAIRVA